MFIPARLTARMLVCLGFTGLTSIIESLFTATSLLRQGEIRTIVKVQKTATAQVLASWNDLPPINSYGEWRRKTG